MLTDTTGELVAAFGCMGGYMQPQGHVQVSAHRLTVPSSCVGGEVHRLKQASAVRMQELKLFQQAATLYACRTSPPTTTDVCHVQGFCLCFLVLYWIPDI